MDAMKAHKLPRMRTTKMLGKMRRRFELSLHFQHISTMQQPSQKRKGNHSNNNNNNNNK
jgi:hypothetical protein